MEIPFFNTGLLGSKRYLDKQEGKVLNFLRAYLESIKILKTEREYSVKALAQFTRVSNLKAIQEGYDYFNNQLQPVPYPSVEAMQAVVTQIAETNPKARNVDAKNYVSDRYLRRWKKGSKRFGGRAAHGDGETRKNMRPRRQGEGDTRLRRTLL
jgi:hypothetical protein